MNSSFKHNANELKIVHWNCFSMTKTRLVELQLFLEEFQPDIMSIQELKLNQNERNLFLRFEGFIVYYKPRFANPDHGGGVAIIVKENLSNSEINNLEDDLENIGIKVEVNDFNFIYISLYSPHDKLKTSTFSNYCKLGKNILIAGDLNAKTPTVGGKNP